MNCRQILSACVCTLIGLLLLSGFSSCNAQKKNTAAARQYTAFITRYNVYYNGDKHYKETLHDMETKYEDDYSQLVLMHPVEAKANEKAPQPQGDFNRSIEKAQKAIQIRSIKKKPAKKSGKGNDAAYKAWMARDEYNPFLHNAWMMMGRSQYYNGDFLGAASTFFYVTKHFTWLPATVTEAKLWQAQSYVSLDWLYEAEIIITRIKPDDLTNKTLTELYNRVYADFWIKSNEYAKAVPYLEAAIKQSSGAQKTRLRFLLGQLYSRLGEKQKAYEAFKAAGSSSSAPYRTKFNARIKQSEVYTGQNIEPEVKALKRMVRYDRNKEYLDQVYYAIGNLYLSRGDTLNAIENYKLAAEKSTRNGIDKAISQITLGNLYFERRNYEKAQPCYAEALPLLPENYPNYKTLKRRSDVLDELAVYSQNVNLQDSLLHLSTLPREDQLHIINKIIEDLKKKEKEEAENAAREEFKAKAGAQGQNLTNNNAPTMFTQTGDNSWYFYNTATRNAGKTDFQRRWGSRKLEDDWRRRNKATFNVNDFDADASGEDSEAETGSGTNAEDAELTPEEKEKKAHADDPHYPEFYLKQIPTTEEEKQTAHDVIQEGLFNMGLILKDKLEDYNAAVAEFDRLLNDYPDNVYRLDTYYNLYLMYMREGNTKVADRYRAMILSEFPESKYALAMRDPDFLDKMRNMDRRQQELYEQTYDDYINNRNDKVHAAYEQMMNEYPLSKIMPKFMFLHALAYVTEKRSEDFNNVLRELLERYPDTDITPVAAAWLKGMAQGKQLNAGSSNPRGMIWDIHLGNDSTATGSDTPANFELNPNAQQLLVLVYPTDRVEPNQLLYDVARHNFRSFVVKDFDLEQMNFGRLGMLIIKGFDNAGELDHYRRVMSASSDFRLPSDVRPIPISVDNFEKMMSENRSFDEYFRFLREQDYTDAQRQLLMPDDIESLQEREAASEPETEAADDTETPIDRAEENATEIAPEPEPIKDEPKDEEANVTPPAKPEAAAQPKTKPEATAQPTTKSAEPQAEPKKSEPAPAVKEPEPLVIPTAPAKPKRPATQLPTYDPGSEGDDDPLLN